jgi:multiple sugar transport system ATP-binding protein
MANVQLLNLSKSYPGGPVVVDGINLDIADREFVVLVGPSGCGKTTTLRMVCGLEEITAGQIRIGGRVVNDVAPKDRDIAMVFQNYALYPHMTVFQNMAFALKLRKMPKAEIQERVARTAKLLEIENLLDRKPKALSGGQRQRVAVGRAIVREPAAFLFDEPLSNLDARLRVSTRAELKRLHQRLKTTTIYVTHDQEEAMTLGDRIVVMHKGRIQQADTPLNTYHKPVNRFVAGFIGMPPMNFFDGKIEAIDGRLRFLEGKMAGGELTFPSGGFTLYLPARLRETGLPVATGEFVGRHVVLGIRPEHICLRPQNVVEAAGPAARIDVRVNVIEPLGSSMDVYMATALSDQLVGRVEASRDATGGLAVDGPATVFVDPAKCHWFAPGETGMNLGLENLSPSGELSHAHT